jgi:glutamate N-acetyltransferase/amino-acid N-acetyltransferase
MLDLAKMIVRDGEGAQKLVEVRVKGARTVKDAARAAEAVALSLLVKCAVHGGDPNWGRVASSVGASGIKFDPELMEIKLDGVVFFRHGKAASPDAEEIKGVFKGADVKIDVNLHSGAGEAVKYTCDMTKEYVDINASYTT